MNKRSINIKGAWAFITLMIAFIFVFSSLSSDSFAADETVQKAKDLMIKAPEGAKEKYELDLSSAATGALPQPEAEQGGLNGPAYGLPGSLQSCARYFFRGSSQFPPQPRSTFLLRSR